MILLTFDRALTEADRDAIQQAFAAVKDGGEKIVVVEGLAVDDAEDALTFSGIISPDHREQAHA